MSGCPLHRLAGKNFTHYDSDQIHPVVDEWAALMAKIDRDFCNSQNSWNTSLIGSRGRQAGVFIIFAMQHQMKFIKTALQVNFMALSVGHLVNRI